MVDYQWGIYWADLNPSKGSEQSGKRPVLVLSVEVVNQILPVVTILAITSVKEGRHVYPTEVYLRAEDTSLTKDSIVMAHQIRSISKDRLGARCGAIADASIKDAVKSAVRCYLEL